MQIPLNLWFQFFDTFQNLKNKFFLLTCKAALKVYKTFIEANK